MLEPNVFIFYSRLVGNATHPAHVNQSSCRCFDRRTSIANESAVLLVTWVIICFLIPPFPGVTATLTNKIKSDGVACVCDWTLNLRWAVLVSWCFCDGLKMAANDLLR